jgi:hypothetical protein
MIWDLPFTKQVLSLVAKIIVVLLLSNAGQTFFVYQNF